ncbi:MAG: hypothetical protein GPJ04_03130 [Microcystis aeruginosa G13-03]|nr:hypothetical protein [Microcystis aeruginosa G13-03]
MVNFFNVSRGKISQKSLREPMNDFWEVRIISSLFPFCVSSGEESGGNLDKLKVSAIPIKTIPA